MTVQKRNGEFQKTLVKLAYSVDVVLGKVGYNVFHELGGQKGERCHDSRDNEKRGNWCCVMLAV
jgi:hypothetical protein